MRWLLLVALMITPFDDAATHPSRWVSKRIPVWSHVKPEWQGGVAEAVAAINAMLPGRGPELVYHWMPEADCRARGIRR